MAYSQQNVSELFKKTLDIHGYGFHYSVMRRVDELIGSAQTEWRLYGAEFPVINKNETTHVDFVLQHEKANAFIIGECKRADPAKANWCFVKTPYTWNDSRENYIQLDKLIKIKDTDGRETICLNTSVARIERKFANLGIEIKTGQTGDGLAISQKSAINSAVTQVSRGTSGFLNYFKEKYVGEFSDSMFPFRFIPVIFTTATLWVSDADLGIADLQTGILPNDSIKAKQVDWIWFNHNRSFMLAPNSNLAPTDKYLSPEYYEFVRSVAIVSASGIDNFFKANLYQWLKESDSFS